MDARRVSRKKWHRQSSSDAFIVVFTIPLSHVSCTPHAIRRPQKSSFGNFDLASLSLFLGIFYMRCPVLTSRARARVCVRRMRVGWKHSDERVGETSNRTAQSGRISPRLELINSNE